jgi:drug/metabolite transporter (DMT)-like permease
MIPFRRKKRKGVREVSKLGRWKGPLSLLGAFTLTGSSVVTAKVLDGALGAFTIAAVSLALALLALIPASGKMLAGSLRRMTAAGFLHLAFQALFGIFLFRMFLLTGIHRTSSTEAGILTGATPAITAMLAMAFLKETPDGRKLSGILCTVAGVLLIQGLAGARFSPDHLTGNLLVLCAAGRESAFNILSRIAAVRESRPIHPLAQTALVTAIALILCAVPALWEHPFERLAAIGIGQWLALSWYGLAVTALAFLLWYKGIRRCGALKAAAFSGMMPFASMILSVLVLGERASGRQWLGGLMVVAGMMLIGTGRRDERKGVVLQ